MALGWPSTFPEVVSNRTVDLLQKHPCFRAAKHGDREAAWALVNDLADPSLMRRTVWAHSNARLLVVSTEEGAGNKIPMAYAHLFERVTGLSLELGVVKANRPAHTGRDAVYRFLHRAAFKGPIMAGQNYVLLDDVVTQGGTISELRQFVHRHGASVVAVACLAHTPSRLMSNGRQLAMTRETREALDHRHGIATVASFLRHHGIYEGNVHCLTESEALFLARIPNLELFNQNEPTAKIESLINAPAVPRHAVRSFA